MYKLKRSNVSVLATEQHKMEIGQTIIIIILIIIAIILVIFLIADVEFPPTPVYIPFADKSKIRIKSLANEKYLRIVGSRAYPNCIDANFGRTGLQVVADIDNPTEDPTTIWTLCQYPGEAATPGNNAVYSVFSGQENSEQLLNFNNQVVKPLLVSTSNESCSTQNTNYDVNAKNPIFLGEISFFSFILQENGASNTNGLKSSSYIMRDGVSGDFIATTTGNPGTALYSGCVNPIPNINPQNCTNANNCPPIITMVNARNVIGQLSPLNYTFSIEVLPPNS